MTGKIIKNCYECDIFGIESNVLHQEGQIIQIYCTAHNRFGTFYCIDYNQKKYIDSKNVYINDLIELK